MANLKFADTQNMVAFLSKPAESEGFKQIVDFLNAHTIKYALTVNPTIYTSCIEQFWATVKAKTVNGEVQLQALVDEKKIINTESIIRRDLQLEYVDGVDCLPNAIIFEQLTLMSSKTTAWNEFSNIMASAIICLATNQKFNFSKYIFESMVKNLDNVFGKFLMYPRSRRSKRKDTEVPQPSGPTTNVADEVVNEEMDDSLERAATTATGLDADSGSGPRRQETMRDTIAQTRSENVSKHSNDPLLARGNTLQSGEDRLKLKELMALCTTLQSRVLALETIKTTQATEIASLKKRVKKLERRNKLRTHGLKRLYKVGSSRKVESFEDESLGEEDASKQGRIADIDANEDIYLVNVQTDEDMFSVNDLDGDEVIVKISAATTTTTTTAITDVEMTLAQALAKLKSAKPKATIITTTPTLTTTTAATIITTVSTRPGAKGLAEEEEEEERLSRKKAQQMEEANIAWDDIQAKLMLIITKRAEEKRNKPPTRAQQRSIMCTYLKNTEGWKPKSLKNKSFSNIQELFDKAMKRVNTFVDYRTELVEESSKKAEIEQEENYGDDVTIDATPLSTKSPTIVDYKIYKEGKKSYFQIIIADVKARFKKTDPVNYMDNFLLLNLKTMFEHHVEDNVWKNQQGLVKVLNWKLYDSCEVHCVTMQNMLFYLLVEKMYPLTNHTLYQMFNDVKL
ncbi:hypothetical protein Tco_0583419 [Tanacetum coccineum]